MFVNRKISGFIKKCAALAAVLSLCITCFSFAAFAEQEEASAQEISALCNIKSTQWINRKGLYDGKLDKEMILDEPGRQALTYELQGEQAAGIYIKWGKSVSGWTLEATIADGSVVTSEHGQHGLLQEYVPLPEGVVSFAIVTQDGKSAPLRMVELSVYSPGVLPESVHIWQPTPTTAEILLVSTHQDDELLFFGGAIPYYAGELKLDFIVAYTAYSNVLRRHEALEGLWTCGLTQHPIFLNNPDRYVQTLNDARRVWDEDEIIRQLAGLYVQYRPQVVLSQDVNGEYGHGLHRLTVYCVQQALEKASDAEYVSEHFAGQELWRVKKCYLHLYEENNISMPWDVMTLESAGGRTALEVAQEAYLCHESQLKYSENYVSTVQRDCRSFGLYWSDVGEDVQKNDFLENTELRYRHLQPEGTADYLERVGNVGWLYRRTDEAYDTGKYLRYCEVAGVPGWYAADETGCLTEPITQQAPVQEAVPDLTGYETVTVQPGEPVLYSYNDGSEKGSVILRYCQPAGQPEAGFYAAGEDGALLLPLTQVEVLPELPPEEPPVQSEKNDSESGLGAETYTVYALCVLSVLLTLVMLLLVLRRRKG